MSVASFMRRAALVVGVLALAPAALAAEAEHPPKLEWTFEGPFGTFEQEQLEAVAPYAAIAMSNATLLERERLSAATAWALADAARQLQQAEHAGRVAPMIADALERLCPEASAIYVEPGTDHPPVTRGPDGDALAHAVETRVPEAAGGVSAGLQG